MFYVLLALCMTAAFASDICHWASYALVMTYIGLGALCEWRQKRWPRVFKCLGVALFFALFTVDIVRGGGLQTMVLSACLNIVWTLLGYRALSHEKTSDRVQVGVIAVLPLACVAFTMSATALIAFLLAYFAVLFAYLSRLALSVPTTGSVAYSARMTDARYLHMPGRRFWLKTSLLGLLALVVGGILFLFIPRWGNDAVSAMPTAQPSRSGFPDVSIDKTGTIEIDPTLMFRVPLSQTEAPRYWRIEVQNIFDGKKWRAVGGHRKRTAVANVPEQTYRLEFVREWRDFRIPTLYGTEAVRLLPESAENTRIRFYPDSADVWHRWGWRRGQPLMGFEFQLYQANAAQPETISSEPEIGNHSTELQDHGEAEHSPALTSHDDLAEDVAFRAHEDEQFRVYYQKTPAHGMSRLSITVRVRETKPVPEVAWRLFSRLNREIKRVKSRNHWEEASAEKPMFHQDTSAFWAHRIWPGRKKNDPSVVRIQSLAQEIVGDARTHEEKAQRVLAYLHAHYAYSLDRPQRRDPIVEDFLFDQKFGHCEMFSTAMAVLLASIDVPVRNVSGFMSDEYRDGMHLVRAAHAHSWVEVFLADGRGWTVFDPTPPGSTEIEIDWLVRIDDWFTSYQTRDLYIGLKNYGLMGLGIVLGVLVLLGLVRFPVRYVRRRLKPTAEVWQMAWEAWLLQCQKYPHAAKLADRSLEQWWEQPEDDVFSQFARDYIVARYAKRVAASSWWQRMKENHRILLRQNETVRALKAQKRAHDGESHEI